MDTQLLLTAASTSFAMLTTSTNSPHSRRSPCTNPPTPSRAVPADSSVYTHAGCCGSLSLKPCCTRGKQWNACLAQVHTNTTPVLTLTLVKPKHTPDNRVGAHGGPQILCTSNMGNTPWINTNKLVKGHSLLVVRSMTHTRHHMHAAHPGQQHHSPVDQTHSPPPLHHSPTQLTTPPKQVCTPDSQAGCISFSAAELPHGPKPTQPPLLLQKAAPRGHLHPPNQLFLHASDPPLHGHGQPNLTSMFRAGARPCPCSWVAHVHDHVHVHA
jgi:hypothetical protein